MPSRVFQDTLELESAVVEPVPMGPDRALLASYPLPLLRDTGRTEALELSVVVLENSRVRATVCPSLGGRLLGFSGLFDLPSRVAPVSGGSRGLWLVHGLQVSLDPYLDSMAEWDSLVHEPEGEGPAAVMLFASPPGSGLSLHVVYSLPAEDNAVRVEVRVFNRTLGARPFRLTVVLDGSETEVVPRGFIAPRDSMAFRFRASASGIEVPSVSAFTVTEAELPSDADPESLPMHWRGAAHLRAASEEAVRQDFGRALDRVDSALATLADDPLSWWQRGVLARLNSDDNEQELTTAHALSPLEPALRAEAFLAMPQTHQKDPSAILKEFSAEDFHETAHLLVEAGLFQEAARLMDEAQRHQELPLLRYMQAWCLMQTTRMDVEASFLVQQAAKSSLAPPLPWRPLEVRAVTELAERFGPDERLNELMSLIQVARS